ncbi:hypothetical protein NT6N_21600 [Oceaniferula spumae]|uniref:Uncharacterized protein n=1 Tax=Oceaniferula spumae TaxID=2979115 RepID=A0AAT9FM74_9BACT
MKFNTIRSTAIGLMLLTQGVCFAQQESEPQVTTRVDLVSIGEEIPGLKIGKSGPAVSALAFRYNKTVRYRGSRIIEISQVFKTSRRPGQEEEQEDELIPLPRQQNPDLKVGQKDSISKAIEKRREKNPELVALAVVPPNARHITILLAKAENETYRAFVINDDPVKLPEGQMRVHNFCNHKVSLRFDGKKAMLLEPTRAKQIKPKNGSNTINYLLAYPKKGKWKIQESNVIRINSQEQVQMIILHSRSSFFVSGSGSRGGHLQVAVLRRDKSLRQPRDTDSDVE